MTRFTDELFDDLMREHGTALAGMTARTAQKRRVTTRPVLLTAGAGGLAVAATVGTLTIGGAAPAYAVTPHSDGTVTLAVYQQPGIAQANAKLHALGDRVVVLPVKSGCPSIDSLRAPGMPAQGAMSVQVTERASTSGGGSVTVNAHGVPAGDILVVAVSTITTGNGQVSGPGKVISRHASGSAPGHAAAGSPAPGAVFSLGASELTSGPVPKCVSIPAPPAGSLPTARKAGGTASCTHSPAPVGSLPPTVQAGGGILKPGMKVSGSCTVIGKAGGVAPGDAGSTTRRAD